MGFLLPPLILAAAMVAVRNAPRARNPGWWVAPLAMALPCLAWVVPALTGGDVAYRERLLGQIAGRISGQEGSHVRWAGYYVEVATPYLLPMTAFLVLGGAVALRPRRAEGEERAGLGAALLAGPILLLVMTLVRTKRDVYLIPGVPFAALAAAWALHRGLWPRSARAATFVLAVACASMAVGLLVLPFLERYLVNPESTAYREVLDPLRWIPLVPAAALMALAAVSAWRHVAEPAVAVRRAAVPWLAAFVLVVVGHLPAIDRFESWQPVGRAAEEAAGAGPIAFAGWYQGPNLLWALERERVAPFPEADDPNLASALAAFLGPDRPRAALVTTTKWWDRVKARAAAEPAVAATVGSVRETYRDQTGQRVLVVLTNAAP
jgi:4-amino-4-deoxy-L-arabinose transferase-like glycosyltransferase